MTPSTPAYLPTAVRVLFWFCLAHLWIIMATIIYVELEGFNAEEVKLPLDTYLEQTSCGTRCENIVNDVGDGGKKMWISNVNLREERSKKLPRDATVLSHHTGVLSRKKRTADENSEAFHWLEYLMAVEKLKQFQSKYENEKTQDALYSHSRLKENSKSSNDIAQDSDKIVTGRKTLNSKLEKSLANKKTLGKINNLRATTQPLDNDIMKNLQDNSPTEMQESDKKMQEITPSNKNPITDMQDSDKTPQNNTNEIEQDSGKNPHDSFSVGLRVALKAQKYWDVRVKFNDLPQTFIFTLSAHSAVGSADMYLQTWRAQLFYIFATPVGFALYYISVHSIVCEFYVLLSYAVYHSFHHRQTRNWTLDQYDLYEKLKTFLFAIYLAVFFLLAFGLISLLVGYHYCFGLYWTVNVLFTISGANAQLLTTVQGRSALAAVLCIAYFACITMFYSVVYSLFKMFKYNRLEELVNLVFRDTDDEEFKNLISETDDSDKFYAYERNEKALYLHAKTMSQHLPYDQPYEANTATASAERYNNDVSKFIGNSPPPKPAASYLLLPHIAIYTDDSDFSTGSLDVPKKRKRRRRKLPKIDMTNELEADMSDHPTLFVPTIKVTSASPETGRETPFDFLKQPYIEASVKNAEQNSTESPDSDTVIKKPEENIRVKSSENTQENSFPTADNNAENHGNNTTARNVQNLKDNSVKDIG